MGEHFRAEVRSHHLTVRDLMLDFQGEIASAARYIHELAGLELLDPFRDHMPPPEIHPSGKDVVREDIAVCDSGEGVADVNGIWHGVDLE
jgi:hypothetical protein